MTLNRDASLFQVPLPISDDNLLRLADAEAALGRLAGAGRLLPHPHLLVRPYLRREAVASTRIEGTQASLLEVFDAEASGEPLSADVEEVVNYVRAMESGIDLLQTLPFSTRLIREMHAVILAGVRGRDRQPGELRGTQTWIGPAGATIETATFVPPPPGELSALLSDLERFVHEDPSLPPLVQAALVHYQFETIHPFLDDGVRAQAVDAVARAERLTDLREQYRSRVREATRGAANELVNLAFEQPVLNARLVEARLAITRPAALTALRQLDELGVLVEVRGGPRGQLRWRAHEILSVLAEE